MFRMATMKILLLCDGSLEDVTFVLPICIPHIHHSKNTPEEQNSALGFIHIFAKVKARTDELSAMFRNL